MTWTTAALTLDLAWLAADLKRGHADASYADDDLGSLPAAVCSVTADFARGA